MKQVLAAVVLMSLATIAIADDRVEYIVTAETKAMNLPFSDAVRVDDMIYLSGTLGVDPATFQLVEGGIVPETKQMFANMKRVLEANGSSLERIVKCTVMMADIAEWPKFNEVYVTYFPGKKPARSAFGASGIALGARAEMECWATVDN